ncbi:HEPN/Toprim-associated domain-containing protein [Streptococcus cameli]
MGTYIELCAHNLTIDWGKNDYYRTYSWLFRDNGLGLKSDNYNHLEASLAMSDKIANVKFRLDNLGYSLSETNGKLSQAIDVWNRTHNFPDISQLIVDFIASIDLDAVDDLFLLKEAEGYVTDADLNLWLAQKIEHNSQYSVKKEEMVASLEDKESYFDGLEDFFRELDRCIILRLLCENPKNLSKELKWFCYDIVDSGWASEEDINYFDDKYFIIEHNKLYGKLNRYAIQQNNVGGGLQAFDSWLSQKGLSQNRYYQQENLVTGNLTSKKFTTPTFIRNIIHHPENVNNTFNDSDLKESINSMLDIIKHNNINLI